MRKKLLSACFAALAVVCTSAQTPTIGLLQHDPGSLDAGYILFSPISSTNTYLIDKCGKLMHSWTSSYKPGQSTYLLDDGTLLRPAFANNSTFNAGGAGGIIQKIDWNSNVTWSYTVSDATQCQHHDVHILPNGNVLVIAWELKTSADAIAAGRNPSLLGASLWCEKIIELQPVGNSSANIVWEWHLWDHLVQEYDSTKLNYGSVAQHPQLVNLNYKATANADWIHMNAIDYNDSLDQVMVSTHNLSEVWIIDHSTTTAEAATHAGGASGRGGDLLYRWGNPAAYNQGTVSDQVFFLQHNPHWIAAGLPHANDVMVFNNGNGRPGGNSSSIDIFTPPLLPSGTYDPAQPYLPAALNWTYADPIPANFYAANISGAQMLPNGNVLICNGPAGTFFEIDTAMNTVWKYINPVSLSGPMSQGSTPAQNSVFRCTYYDSAFSGFSTHPMIPGQPVELNPYSYTCSYNTTTGLAELRPEENTLFYPNPASGSIMISGKTSPSEISIYNAQSALVFHSGPSTHIDVQQWPAGIYFIRYEKDGAVHNQKLLIVR